MKKEPPLYLTLILMVLALASFLFGIYNGETTTILTKAINICMECIGLG